MNTSRLEALILALLTTTGRSLFTVEEIHAVINPFSHRNSKQVKAYNLADGTLTQSEIAKTLKLDSGNFSRTVARWVDSGIMFRLEDGLLLHLYKVPEILPKRGSQ